MLHRRTGLPAGWRAVVDENFALWTGFDAGERDVLEGTSDWLLRHKHWEAAHGFELTDEMTVTIAVQAALLVLGLDVGKFREVSTIIVYPSAMQSRGVYAGPVRGTLTDRVLPVLGEAHEGRGPVLLAWDQARSAAQDPGHGHNVVFHEFAHKIDMLDQLSDGTPPLDSPTDLARWVEVCTEAYAALQAGVDRPPLQPYGATNPAEFFAVATEAFFDVPVDLRLHEPNLYEVLRSFFNQDPAARVRR